MSVENETLITSMETVPVSLCDLGMYVMKCLAVSICLEFEPYIWNSS